MGPVAALVFSLIGAASGLMGAAHVGFPKIPVFLSSLLAVIGWLMALIILGSLTMPENGLNTYSTFSGFAHLGAGLTCGLSNWIAGTAMHHILKKQNGVATNTKTNSSETTEERECFLPPTTQKVEEYDSCQNHHALLVGLAGSLSLFGFIFALILCQNVYICEAN